MADHTYVTKGYSTYTDIPSRAGGYDRELKNPIHGYIVETTTIERVRGPIVAFTNYNGSPSKIDLKKEYVHIPHMSDESRYGAHNGSPRGGEHYNGFRPNYGPNHRTSSPISHYEPNHKTSSPIRHHRPNYDTSSPTHQYRPSHGTSSPSYHHQPNYENLSPTQHYKPVEAVDKYRLGNFPNPNKYQSSSPTHNYNSGGARLMRTESLSSPNNNWMSAGPPNTRHPLTTPTNDINEALDFLDESMNHPVRPNPKRGEKVLDDLSTRPQQIEPIRQYSKPSFVETTDNDHYKTRPTSKNAIDSVKAMWKYRGARVP